MRRAGASTLSSQTLPARLLRKAGMRAAGLFGYELRPALPAGEACIVRLKEIRTHLLHADADSRPFLEFCLENLAVSHADIFQDLFVLFETDRRRGGFFVEFGAADGVTGSNTYALETRYGWSGIAAEPARCWHEALDRSRACIVDHRCVTDRTGEMVMFRECRHPAVSTLDEFADADRFAWTRRDGTRYAVPTVSLTDLLDEHRAPHGFDYLSLDTEGSELMILRGFDFRRYRPRIITVEHCHSPAREALFELLSSHGYHRKYAALSQVEDWYVRD